MKLSLFSLLCCTTLVYSHLLHAPHRQLLHARAVSSKSSTSAKLSSSSKASSTLVKSSSIKTSSTVKSTSTAKSSSSSTVKTSSSIQKSSTTTTSSTNPASSSPSTSSSFSSSISSSTSIVCAPKYTNSVTITGTGTLPKPTSFVKRNGANGLSLDGKPYRIAGPNIFWLALENDTTGKPLYPDKARVREALAAAVAMGANTVRSLSLGISLGNALSIEPTLNTYVQANYDAADYAIFAAGQYGLRVIITVSSNYDYYMGGKYTYLRWLNQTTANYGQKFYTYGKAITALEKTIRYLAGHKNPYTKKTWANDPTIIAWETGNELGAYMLQEGQVPNAWTTRIAAYLRQWAPNQLIIDGSDGIWNYTTKESAPGLQVADIDISSDHLYPLSSGLFTKDLQLVSQYSKNLLIGEYDWTGMYGGQSLSDFLKAVEATTYVGHMMWSIMGHDAQCCAFVSHNDGYSAYYPNGNAPAQQANLLLVAQSWYRMTGRTPPQTLPAVACPQKVF